MRIFAQPKNPCQANANGEQKRNDGDDGDGEKQGALGKVRSVCDGIFVERPQNKHFLSKEGQDASHLTYAKPHCEVAEVHWGQPACGKRIHSKGNDRASELPDDRQSDALVEVPHACCPQWTSATSQC